MNFGTANSLFTTADGQVLGGGGGALSILCSSGTTPTVKVRAGAHDGMSPGGTRALYDGVANYVPYDFYTDAGHSQLLAIDGDDQPRRQHRRGADREHLRSGRGQGRAAGGHLHRHRRC